VERVREHGDGVVNGLERDGVFLWKGKKKDAQREGATRRKL